VSDVIVGVQLIDSVELQWLFNATALVSNIGTSTGCDSDLIGAGCGATLRTINLTWSFRTSAIHNEPKTRHLNLAVAPPARATFCDVVQQILNIDSGDKLCGDCVVEWEDVEDAVVGDWSFRNI